MADTLQHLWSFLNYLPKSSNFYIYILILKI